MNFELGLDIGSNVPSDVIVGLQIRKRLRHHVMKNIVF